MMRLSRPTSSACLMKAEKAGAAVLVPAMTAGFRSTNLLSRG
jgi:hypothetical protein